MNGSNRTALRQHAYSVFTASRREHAGRDDVPESVLRPIPPAPARPSPATPAGRDAFSRSGLAEAKPFPPEPRGESAAAAVIRAVSLGATPAVRARAPFVDQPPASKGVEPTQDEVRRRAYEHFEARHGEPGDPVADWLRAEAELRRERGLA